MSTTKKSLGFYSFFLLQMLKLNNNENIILMRILIFLCKMTTVCFMTAIADVSEFQGGQVVMNKGNKCQIRFMNVDLDFK